MPELENTTSEALKEEIIEEVPLAYQHPDLWIYQLDSSDIIDSLEHKLRGEIWNKRTNKWEKRGKKLLNDDGVRMMVTIVGSHLSKEKILTDITEDEVNRMCRSMRFALIHHLRMRWKTYKLDKSNLDILVNIIDHHIFCNLSRSISGRTMDYFKPTLKRTEIIKPEEKEKKYGWIPFFGR